MLTINGINSYGMTNFQLYLHPIKMLDNQNSFLIRVVWINLLEKVFGPSYISISIILFAQQFHKTAKHRLLYLQEYRAERPDSRRKMK